MDFEQQVSSLIEFLKKYIGMSFDDLACLTKMVSKSKSRNALLVNKLIDSYKGAGYGKALLEHESIWVKTIQTDCQGIPNESMSFPTMDFSSLIEEKWENSTLRKQFSYRFLFFVFEEKENRKVFLQKIFLWKMSEKTLDGEVKPVWLKTKEVLLSGNVVNQINAKGNIVLNFPKEKDTKVCHVRPHGRNSMDLANLPKRDANTRFIGLSKQSFWLNKKYVAEIIKQN